MKRAILAAMSLVIAFGMTACGAKKADNAEIIDGADESTTIELPSTVGKESDVDALF